MVVWVVAVGVGVGGLGCSYPSSVTEPGHELLPSPCGDHGRPGREGVIQRIVSGVRERVSKRERQKQRIAPACEVSADHVADVVGFLSPDLAGAFHATCGRSARLNAGEDTTEALTVLRGRFGDGDTFTEGPAAGADAQFLGPGLLTEGVGFKPWAEGTPVHLLQPFLSPISSPSGLVAVKRPSCLRITKTSGIVPAGDCCGHCWDLHGCGCGPSRKQLWWLWGPVVMVR